MGNSCRTDGAAHLPSFKILTSGSVLQAEQKLCLLWTGGTALQTAAKGKGMWRSKNTVYIQNREHSRCVRLNGRRAQVWIQGVVLLLSACVSWVSGWSRCLKPGFISRTQVPYDISGLLLNLCVYILLILPWLLNCLSRTLENLKINYRSAKWYYLAILLPMFLYVKQSFDSSVII